MTDSPHGARVHTQRQLYLLRNLLSACLTAIGTPCMISLASSSAPLIVKERTRAVVEVAACGGRVTILPHTFLYTAISFVPKSVVYKGDGGPRDLPFSPTRPTSDLEAPEPL